MISLKGYGGLATLKCGNGINPSWRYSQYFEYARKPQRGSTRRDAAAECFAHVADNIHT